MVYDSNNNEYTVTGGVLTITKGASGTGVMPNFTSASTVRTLVGEDFTTVVMDSTMTNVGDYAFFENTALIDITMSSSLTSIGLRAFRGCTNLNLTELPSSLTSIGAFAFLDCTNLVLTSLPSSLTSIGIGAFQSCANLVLTSLPSSLTSIGLYTFSGCAGLTTFTLPSSITSIGGSAFYGCTNLASVTMQGTTPATIGASSFPTTTTIYVPNGCLSAYQTAWSAYANQIVELPNPVRQYTVIRSSSRLPTGYREVEYIQSTGTQYIDSGISGAVGYRYVGKTLILSHTTTGAIVGCTDSSGLKRNFVVYVSNTEWLTGYSGTAYQYYGKFEDNVVYSFDVSNIAGEEHQSINGTNYPYSPSGIRGDFWNGNLYLFASNKGGSPGMFTSIRLYSLSITNENDNKVADYVPCIRTSDNAVGMYDLVTNQFYGNAGTGEFIAGPVVKTDTQYTVIRSSSRLPTGYREVEYIQFTGTQYIDTGIVPLQGDSFKFNASVASTGAVISSGTGVYQLIILHANALWYYKYFATGGASEFSGLSQYSEVNIESDGDLYINGALATTSTPEGSTNTSLIIGRRANGGNLVSMTLGNFLWKHSDDSLVCNFIPCIRKSDSKPGMYDTVTDQFFANSATSGADFIAGPVVSRTKLYRLIRG